MLTIAIDILTVMALLAGMFFMFIGALGVFRFPDFFNRVHAASKCVTLGITGLLLAVVLHVWALRSPASAPPMDQHHGQITATDAVGAMTKAILVIIFQFVASPVGAHILARAAHRDGAKLWEQTRGDELTEDMAALGRVDATRE